MAFSTQELYDTIIEKLKFQPNLDEAGITIAIKENGVVVLGGKVKSYAEKQLAEETAKKVENVQGVVNELEVDLSLANRRSDIDIAESVIKTLRADVYVPDERIKVTVENGHVILSGEVDYYYQGEHAERAIRNFVGVINITNNIEVKPDIEPTNVKQKIIEEFERNARIDAGNIEVEVKGTEVTLKGQVRNFDEREEAKTAAWSIPGVTKVNDLLTVIW